MTEVSDTNEGGLRRLNLNLLYSLDAILNSESLTAAGHRVHLTQPAMSAALRRLREHFGDELVVHKGPCRGPTALGKVLRPRVRRLIIEADGLFGTKLKFDPETAPGSIAIAAPEEIEILLLGLLVPFIVQRSKLIELEAMPMGEKSISAMFEQGADLVLTRAAFADPAFDCMALMSDYLTCLAWEQNSKFGEALSPSEFLSSRHAAMADDDRLGSVAGLAADQLLEQRDIAVRTTSHFALASCVIGTELVATGSVWMFQYFAATMPVRLVTPPFAPDPEAIVAQWPKQRSGDPRIRWLLDCILEVCKPYMPRTQQIHPGT